MINKKNLLGKTPLDLGDKDAIHVAIVAVRAGGTLQPGGRFKLNEHREAVSAEPKDALGVVDPFLKDTVLTGQAFWGLLNQDEVPNVRHVWEHPTADFAPPTREVQRNKCLQEYADALGVTYQQLMAAASYVVANEQPAKYPGTLSAEDLQSAIDDDVDMYDLWSEWAGETDYEFENYGSACCPEYSYPEGTLFEMPE